MVNTVSLLVVALATLLNVGFVAASEKLLSLDTSEWTANDTGFIPGEDLDIGYDYGSSIAERKKCPTTKKCIDAGGSCIKSRASCDGTEDARSCKGKKCKCCTPYPTTYPSCPTIKCPSCPTVKCPSCPTVKCPSCPTVPDCPTISASTCTPTTTADQIKCPSCPTVKCPSCPTVPTCTPTTTEGCPESFFQTPGSSQCYKYYNDTLRTWTDAKRKCQNEGLVLAEPTNPLSLRKYIAENYKYAAGGPYTFAYLGARGDDSSFRWERSGQQISNSDSLWKTGNPGIRVTTKHCLMLLSERSWLSYKPNQIYQADHCSTRRCTVCEYVKK